MSDVRIGRDRGDANAGKQDHMHRGKCRRVGDRLRARSLADRDIAGVEVCPPHRETAGDGDEESDQVRRARCGSLRLCGASTRYRFA